MALGADDRKTAGRLHFGRQLDVGTAARHVGGDGHLSRTAGFGHDLRFQLVLLGVQDVVFDPAQFEHTAQQLRNLDRRRTDEYRTARFDQPHDFVDHGVVFLALGLVDQIFAVVAQDRFVGRDDHDVELVDAPELRSLRLGRTGHTGQLVIHAEIVLQGDRGEGLRRRFDLHALLGFDGLVQAVRIAAPVEDTPRLFVDDLHLVVHHHVFDVFLEHGVGFQQLVDRVHALRLDRIVVDHLVALLRTLLVREVALLQLGHLGADVGQHEEPVLVEIFRQHLVSLVGQFHRIEFFVDDEEQVVGDLRHTAVVVLHVGVLGLLHQCLDARFREVFDQRLVLGQALVGTVELHAALVVLALRDKPACLGQQARHEVFLQVVEMVDGRAVLLEELVVAFGYRAGDDERRTGVVDQHRVDLVDDGEVVLALHQIGRRRGHVVTQVVEAVFVVRTERDVGHVCLAAGVGVGLRVVDAGYRKPVELVHRAHPLRVSLGQVVVHRDQVHALLGQCVEEYGERRHECLSFTRRHLGDFTFVEHYAAEQLYVVMDHVPFQVVAARHPVVGVDGLIALDTDEILLGGQIPVEIVGRDDHLVVLREAACRILHDGEGFGQYLVEFLLDLLVDAFGRLVDLLRDTLLLLQRGFGQFKLGLQFHDVGLVPGDEIGDLFLQRFAPVTQFVVRKGFYRRVHRFDLLEVRLDLLAVFVGFRAEEKFD